MATFEFFRAVETLCAAVLEGHLAWASITAKVISRSAVAEDRDGAHREEI